MEIKRIVGGVLHTDTYIVNGTSVIDPGADIEKIEKYIQKEKLKTVILTHGHLDHIYNANILKEEYGAKIYIHKDDEKFLSDFSLSSPFGLPEGYEKREYSADFLLSDNDEVNIGGVCFRVIHTPGHTPGSICLYSEDEKVLFSGDTVFKGTYGRIDFPLGSDREMISSLRRFCLEIPDGVRIYPGHGLSTLSENEKILYERLYR